MEDRRMAKHKTIEELRRAVADAAADWIEAELSSAAETAQWTAGWQWGSPIEERMFLGLAVAAQERRFAVDLHRTCVDRITWSMPSPLESPRWNFEAAPIPERVGYAPIDLTTQYNYGSLYQLVRVFTQVKIGTYSADMVVEWSLLDQDPITYRSVIECDGHDFHERTKEQARHDRRRDRTIQEFGLPVLRFTGSEIHADAAACGRQVMKFFESLEERRWGSAPREGQ
jgi:very-short-patch-repair endonuclease